MSKKETTCSFFGRTKSQVRLLIARISVHICDHCIIQAQFFFSSRRRHTRSVSAFLLNRSSDLTAKDISNVVTDAASGVVDIFHGIDKAVADTWNNFWKDGKADGIGSNLSRK